MHCKEILFTPRCSPKAREFPRVNIFVRRTVVELPGRQNCTIFGFSHTKLPKVPSGDQPTAQGLHRRMIPIFPCGSRRSNEVTSGTGVFLRLLVGELGTPKLAKILPMANGYTHAECYYTRRVRSGPKMSENALF